jgi:hypothetical protein
LFFRIPYQGFAAPALVVMWMTPFAARGSSNTWVAAAPLMTSTFAMFCGPSARRALSSELAPSMTSSPSNSSPELTCGSE